MSTSYDTSLKSHSSTVQSNLSSKSTKRPMIWPRPPSRPVLNLCVYPTKCAKRRLNSELSEKLRKNALLRYHFKWLITGNRIVNKDRRLWAHHNQLHRLKRWGKEHRHPMRKMFWVIRKGIVVWHREINHRDNWSYSHRVKWLGY